MTMKIDIDKRSIKVFVSIGLIDENMRRGIRQSMYKIGKLVMSDLSKDMMRKPRSGTTYARRDSAGRKRRHISSVPGEAAANWTGKMRRSREFSVTAWHTMNMGYGVKYGDWVEKGTKNMRSRPGMLLNLLKNERNMEVIYSKEIKKALKA